MKRLLALFLFVTVLLLVFFSCKKEYSLENGQKAKGFLLKDASGNCFPVTTNGLYRINTNLNDSNSLLVSVFLTQAGRVVISSDTVNGYFFSYNGNVSDTGMVNIVLKGNGMPVAKGINHFTIRFDSTICNADVSVIDPNAPASYTLSVNGITCINDTVYGNFIKGEQTTFSNRIGIEILVAAAGSWHIHTDTVNGISFSGSGFLRTTGLDTVFIIAEGIPLQAGRFTYHVYADSADCSVSVTTYEFQVTSNTDLFPLTYPSKWHYNDYIFNGTLQRDIVDSTIVGGKLYKKMHEVTTYATTDYLFRKEGLNYFQYTNADAYTSTIVFLPVIKADLIFLKEFMMSGDTWYSDLYTGTVTFGQSINIRYQFTCIGANVNEVVNGKAFSHVYKVLMTPQVAAAGINPGNTHESWVFWYAKGVGLIFSSYQSAMINTFTVY